MALWRNRMSLLHQFEVELDNFEQVLRECPDDLWEGAVWKVDRTDRWIWPRGADGELLETDSRTEESIQVFGAFWYIAFHCLFHLDLYLTSDSSGFDTPAPFGGPDEHSVDEQMAAILPNRVYTKAELLDYLSHGRDKARSTISELTEAGMREAVKGGHPWVGVPFNILLRTNLKHVREHRMQLERFLRKRLGAPRTSTAGGGES